MPTRKILLIDADAFFVAVARRAYPDLATYPYLLIGGAPGSRSVVSSASYECRAMGATSGMSMDMAMRLCPKAISRPVPWVECKAISTSIREIIEEIAPLVEAASIDEWYADLTDTDIVYPGLSLTQIAVALRSRIMDSLGLTVSIGCATNKLVAKVAAEHAKPSTSTTGVVEVLPREEASFMAPQALVVIPGVGPKLESRLLSLGLKTCADVVNTPLETLSLWLDVKLAAWLHAASLGESVVPLVSSSDSKSVSRDTTFPSDLSGFAAVWPHLVGLIDSASSDLRAQGIYARTVAIKLRLSNRTDKSRQKTGPAMATDPELRAVARTLLVDLLTLHPGPVRFISISLKNLTRTASPEQSPLFESQSMPQVTDHPSINLLDSIRSKFGKTSIGWAITPRDDGSKP